MSGIVTSGYPASVDWAATAAPAELTADERMRLVYRAAAEVAAALAAIPGWRVQRGGVAIRVWTGPERQRDRPPDYTIWAEDYVDQHLRKSIEAAAIRKHQDTIRPPLPAGYKGVRRQVTWVRAGQRTTHPWQVLVTDPEGTERAYDNWAEAAADSAERARQEQS